MSQSIECREVVWKGLGFAGGTDGNMPDKSTERRYFSIAAEFEPGDKDERDETFDRHSETRMRIPSIGRPSLQDATHPSVGIKPLFETYGPSSISPPSLYREARSAWLAFRLLGGKLLCDIERARCLPAAFSLILRGEVKAGGYSLMGEAGWEVCAWRASSCEARAAFS